MLEILLEFLNRAFEGINIKYLRERSEENALARIGADLFELLIQFERISFTGRKIIFTLENYVEGVVLRGNTPRSLALEGTRLEMLELIEKQRLNIKCVIEDLESRRDISAYASSRSLMKLQEFVWMKRGPLVKLRTYFDEGYYFDRTGEYLSRSSRNLIREIDGNIDNSAENTWTIEQKRRIFSAFDLDGAEDRLNDIDLEIQKWRDHLNNNMNMEKIILELHRRGKFNA